MALVERDYPHIIPEERNGSGVSGENMADRGEVSKGDLYNWLIPTITILIPILIAVVWRFMRKKRLSSIFHLTFLKSLFVVVL
ncbi:MAG TPA: hypothetical protein ENF47_00355 [Thermoprotei archaeon]|nr:hypothetical protein [Thermoprotei archaeon]